MDLCEDCRNILCRDCNRHYCLDQCPCARYHNCACECGDYDRRMTYAD